MTWQADCVVLAAAQTHVAYAQDTLNEASGRRTTMGRRAENVYTARRDIERIQRLVVELPSQAHVRVTMKNGNVITGTVIERPAAQLFEDASGAAGMNGQLYLDDPSVPSWSAHLWLGDVVRVERLIEN